jgi:hypothetical protein
MPRILFSVVCEQILTAALTFVRLSHEPSIGGKKGTKLERISILSFESDGGIQTHLQAILVIKKSVYIAVPIPEHNYWKSLVTPSITSLEPDLFAIIWDNSLTFFI